MKIVDLNSTRKNTTSRDSTTSVASRYVEPRTARRRSSTRTGSTRTGSDTLTATPKTRSGREAGSSVTTVTNTQTTIVTAGEVATRSGRHSRRSRRIADSSSKVVINGDNNVIVQGNVTAASPRPHVSTRRLSHDISYVHHRPRWKSHSGLYFSFNWSNSSCGRVAYLPYRYHHSWCRYPIGYHRPYYGLSYYYPRYHRKYIYVSLGGYWPTWYRHRRYYWYGCHPYYWYGSHVITEPYQNVTYNTYNYYTTEESDPQPSGYGFTGSSQPYYTLGEHDSEDVVDEPEYESAADLCFDHGVALFEAGNYEDAVQQFRDAVTLEPDDIVLPFTYCQALFANGEYALAASVLRAAIGNIPDDELTIYYPRGLYDEETRLDEQIKQLENAIDVEPFDADYQLLLGYQYLGKGDLDKSNEPLASAAQNPANHEAAGKLLELAAILEKEISD